MKHKFLIPILVTAMMTNPINVKAENTNYTYEDIKNLQNFLLKIPTENSSQKSYDLNGDGKENVVDLCLILKDYYGIQDNTKISSVDISFDYTRTATPASNQIAVWVEDANGTVIKTIYVSDFTAARRGYEQRKDVLKHWVTVAVPSEITDSEIDSVSGATPSGGTQTFIWNFEDKNGNKISSGRYYIKLEGTLYWSSNVLYTAEIDLDNASSGNVSVIEERSEPDNSTNENMIRNVKVNVR